MNDFQQFEGSNEALTTLKLFADTEGCEVGICWWKEDKRHLLEVILVWVLGCICHISLSYVLGPVTYMAFVLCWLSFINCPILIVLCLCLMFYVPCSMSYVLCPMSYVLCSMPVCHVLCPMSHVPCLMSYVPCLMSYVPCLCAMSYVPCPMSNASIWPPTVTVRTVWPLPMFSSTGLTTVDFTKESWDLTCNTSF